MPSLIEAFKDDNYRIGDAQAIVYSRERTAIFHEGFLAGIYLRLKGDRFHDSGGNGILETLFCGMQDYSFDSIVSYLAKLPIVVTGVWNGDEFEPAGFGFSVASTRTKDESMAFCGYTLFRKWWGTQEAAGLAMLGLCAMFGEWKLSAIHGFRYVDNHLTARFMRQFGFKDIGCIQRYMIQRGQLAPAIVSSLMIEDFEDYIRKALIDSYAAR
jgi:RimJ/RimL family protein N-acetyltransferase